MSAVGDARKRQTARAAGELVADVDMLAAAIRRVDGNHDLGAGALAEALVAAGFGRVDAARREIAQAERRGAERVVAAVDGIADEFYPRDIFLPLPPEFDYAILDRWLSDTFGFRIDRLSGDYYRRALAVAARIANEAADDA